MNNETTGAGTALPTAAPESLNDRARRHYREAGWTLLWRVPGPVVDGQKPCHLECWQSGDRRRLSILQLWPSENGSVSYFQGGGETWPDLLKELIR